VATVVLSPFNVTNAPEVGGHFWVYMQYAQGLRRLGCDVYWLEEFRPSGDLNRDACLVAPFLERMDRFGLGGKVLLYKHRGSGSPSGLVLDFLGVESSQAEQVIRRADLLLNFHYRVDPELLARFQRTTLVDIDPGLLQFWISTGQLTVPQHDVYFTISETVRRPFAKFPDCRISWVRIRAPVSLESWPFVYDERAPTFTTVSSWWGDEFITNGRDVFYENNKRVTFLDFVEVPERTDQALELALFLGEGDANEPASPQNASPRIPVPEHLRRRADRHPYVGDAVDRRLLERHGWRIRHAAAVAGSPEAYQSYIQQSRGEFSCAKPSCMELQNAWVSDRTICYLASGKPAVVQNTGPSAFLPNGEGLFRFSTLEEAAGALATINSDYGRHCRAAREIAETFFDAKQVAERILNSGLSPASWGQLIADSAPLDSSGAGGESESSP